MNQLATAVRASQAAVKCPMRAKSEPTGHSQSMPAANQELVDAVRNSLVAAAAGRALQPNGPRRHQGEGDGQAQRSGGVGAQVRPRPRACWTAGVGVPATGPSRSWTRVEPPPLLRTTSRHRRGWP